FILIRPAQKQRKQLESQQSALKVGDKVVAMGIVGTVSKIEADTVILKMVDGSKIEVVKRAITEVVSGSEPVKAE
ncbi:MAG: preprotein translocase subunit YajC, partial [Parachlamydiaceae bacterium]